MMRLGFAALVLGGLLLGNTAAAQDPPPVSAAPVHFVDATPVGPSLSKRLGVIRQRIQDAIEYPALARMQRVMGETLVRFDIDNQGTPQAVAVHRSSGAPSLDRAAQRAVTSAAPLPWVYGRLEVPVRFALEERR